jgi:hypothetical protein
MAFPWLGSPEACVDFGAPNLKIRNFRAPLAARNPIYRIFQPIDRQIHPFVRASNVRNLEFEKYFLLRKMYFQIERK